MRVSHNRKKWEDLPSYQKIAIITLGIFQVLLLVTALIDLCKRSPQEITGGDKRIWRVVVFINTIGPIAYFLFGRKPTEVFRD